MLFLIEMIRFNYLYRDYSNYKNYGNIVLGNPNCLTLVEIDEIIREKLIDGEMFNATKVGLPSLFFEVSNCDDHDLHEFMGVELTNENDSYLTIEEFTLKLCL